MRTTGTFGAAAGWARKARLRSSRPGGAAFGVAVIAFSARTHGHIHSGNASLGGYIAIVVVVGGYFAWRFFARRRRGGS
jgi:hypothetical protein